MKAIIKIIKQNWTGWVPEQPKPEETTVEANIGDSLITGNGLGNPKITVKDISNDAIVLLTSNLAPRKHGTGIDLRGDYSSSEFVLHGGESIKFSTQTMDAGTSYTVTCVDTRS